MENSQLTFTVNISEMQHFTKKQVKTLFFEKRENYYSLWQFEFQNPNDYNSIILTKSQCYEIN